MKSCFTFDEIREIENQIIQSENVPSVVLMENAGKNSCDTILETFPDISDNEIFIICGKGNNAGDGFTLARHLMIKNIYPVVVLLVPPDALKGDALINYELLKKNQGEFIEYNEFINLNRKFQKKKNILIIDAVLGTGIKGLLDEQYLNVINSINGLKEKNRNINIISLDVPSGLMSGEQINPVINADMTISMGTFKKELLFGKGKENSGSMTVVPIGICESVIDKYNSFGKYLVEFEDVRKLFPKRKKVSHKYANGKVLVIGGSKGLSGAVVMSSHSALKSGAGGVVAAIPESISPVFNRKLFEVMTVELEETDDGTIKNNQYEKIKKRIEWADVVLLGPGISTNDLTNEFVIEVIKNCEKPLVIDADGLNNLSYDLNILKSRKVNNDVFLTPHLGEFSRLTKVDIKEIQQNRFEILQNFVEEYNVNVSFKSETTVSCFTSSNLRGKFFINSSGNEALASAGSGDVLSGIIASVYAQTKDPYRTLICGNYLHGFCADLYEKKFGNKQTATPQDILKLIPKAISKILL
jgi:hydroxyethylthiazole kinase-like uncharacterized protein yjeF